MPENSNLMHVMVVCIYLFSMVATLNFNCDNILVASYIKFVIIEFDNFRYSFTYVMNLIPIKRFFAFENRQIRVKDCKTRFGVKMIPKL